MKPTTLWEYFLIWLKGIFGLQTNEELLILLVSRMVTPDVLEYVKPIIVDLSEKDIPGEEKKKHVLELALKAGKVLNRNAVNLIVELMKQQGTIPRSYEERAKKFRRYTLTNGHY